MDIKPSVVAIVPYKIFPPQMGGQKGIALFYASFSKLVSLTCLTTRNNKSNENYSILNLMNNALYRYVNPFLFFTIQKIAKKQNAKYILFEHPYLAWVIFLLSTLTPYKIIVHSHNIESERFKSIGKWWWKILWHYEKIAYRNAHVVWFKTDEDKQFAIRHFRLTPSSCETIPYGVSMHHLPAMNELEFARRSVCEQHQIKATTKLILFNGTLSYKPNLDALMHILNEINPRLLATSLDYKILICGKNLPQELNELEDYKDKNVVYCGFVDDIDVYFKACDLFINPLQDGGGIKTKLVEALGFGKPCISSINGAIGVTPEVTNYRLKICNDNDWDDFCHQTLITLAETFPDANETFYQHFAWRHIAQKAYNSLPR